MISVLQALAIGDAVRVVVAPPEGAVGVRLLRKPTADILVVDDPGAALVWDGDPRDPTTVDRTGLRNGVPAFYRPFYTLDGESWSPGDAHRTVTPDATARAIGPDPLELVRGRIEAGLEVERLAGRVPGASDDGDLSIAVVNGVATLDGVPLPVVTVHLRSDDTAERGIGEMTFADVYNSTENAFYDGDGVLSRVVIDFAAWVVGNGDTRILLRQALKKVLVGNFEVFADAGLVGVNLSFNDSENLEEMNAPVFMAMGSISFLAPFAVTSSTPAIDDVDVTGTAIQG